MASVDNAMRNSYSGTFNDNLSQTETYRVLDLNRAAPGIREEHNLEEDASVATTQAVDMTTLTRTSHERPTSRPGAFRVRGINSIATEEYYQEESASMNATSQAMELPPPIPILSAITVDEKSSSLKIREQVIEKAVRAVEVLIERDDSSKRVGWRFVGISLLSIITITVLLIIVVSSTRNSKNHSETFMSNNGIIYGTEWIQIGQKLLASYGQSDFGESLDLNADATRLAIGSNNELGAGGVKVMEYGGVLLGWMQLGNIIRGNNKGENFGSAVQLNSLGDILVVGGFGSSTFGKNAKNYGQVTGYKYLYDFKMWVPIGESVRGIAKGDRFGISLSISSDGTSWIAGADNYHLNGNRDGYASIYELKNENWVQKGSDIVGENGSMTGHAVAMSGDGQTVCVGDPKHKVKQGFRPGRVRCFVWWENEWKRKGKNDILGEENLDLAGYSLSLNYNGNIVAVGAPQRLLAGPSGWGKGYVMVYKLEKGDWILQGFKLTGTRVGDKIGHRVALNAKGDVLAYTGRSYDIPRANDTGVVKVKQCLRDEWVNLGSDIYGESEDDFFGETVALSESGTVLVSSANWDIVEYVNAFELV